MDLILLARWTRGGLACVLAVTFLALLAAFGASPALAQTNLVTNGSFAITGGTTSFQFGTYVGSGDTIPNETLPGWTSTGYNFVFLPTSTVASGTYGSLSLFSSTTTPANSFNNASPTGGNFIAADADYGTEAIQQTISGLTVGKTYAVSFAWAGAQQTGNTGATTEQWQVSLGSSTQDTPVVDNVSQGFTGWMDETFDFVATSSSEVLSFLASGTPAGTPPFALLANVSMTQVPEPAEFAVLAAGLTGLIAVRRRRANPRTIP